jgi:hypothetical protein
MIRVKSELVRNGITLLIQLSKKMREGGVLLVFDICHVAAILESGFCRAITRLLMRMKVANG